LLKSYIPESPTNDFSDRVMNRIFEEQRSLEQVKRYPVLGRSFWVFLSLFAVLIALVVIYSVTSGSDPERFLSLNFDLSNIFTGYLSLLTQTGTMPLSMASILIATSLLILLENFLDKRFNYPGVDI